LPKYSYHCERCRESIVVFQTYEEFDEHPIDECPECGGRIDQVFGPIPAIYRGSGFFSTDRHKTVLSESGVPAHLVSETDEHNIMMKSPQRHTSKGKPLATPTAPTRRKI